MKELMDQAAILGVSVHVQHFDDPSRLGYYSASKNRIVLRMGMTIRETRCVLAHEIAHARLGHTCSGGPEERRADVIAASMMINPESYARAEAIDASAHSIADELDVTVDLVQVYREVCLQRLGQRTYGVSRRVGLHGDKARQLSI